MRVQPFGILVILVVSLSLPASQRSEATTIIGEKFYPYMAELGKRIGTCETFRDLYDFYKKHNFDEKVEIFIKEFHQDNLHKVNAKSKDEFWNKCERMKELDEQHMSNDLNHKNHTVDKERQPD